MAILAMALAMLAGAEKEISRNYVDSFRATSAAESGIYYAVNLLKDDIQRGNITGNGSPAGRAWLYWGDVTNESAPGASPNSAVSVEEAKNPSFAFEDETPQNPADGATKPKQITVEGNAVGFTNIVGSAAFANSEIFTVKITDESGKIYINDGIGNASNTENLKIVLNNLGAQVGVANLGTTIVDDSRRGKGYKSVDELKKYFSTDEFQKFEYCLTTHAWVDTNVVNPVPLSQSVLADYPVKFQRPSAAAGSGKPPSYPASWDGKIYRYGRGKNFRGISSTLPQLFYVNLASAEQAKVYGFDELNPQYIEVTSRAPVDINTAPREVLIALLDGIQGFFVMETPSHIEDNGYDWVNHKHFWDGSTEPPTCYGDLGTAVPSDIGIIYKTDIVKAVAPGTSASTPNIANAIADKIIENRNRRLGTGDIAEPYHGPFTSWAQFNLFIDSLIKDGIIRETTGRFTPGSAQESIATQAIADALKANFNPNLHLNEINPNHNIYLLVDKTDLIYRTTEFCFAPSGYFKVESLGRVLRPDNEADSLTATDNKILAEQKIAVIVKLYDTYRESAQKNFYGGKFTIDGLPSPDPDMSNYINGERTNNNYPLETGPEADNGLAPQQNEYEGYIQLATYGGVLPVSPFVTSPAAGKVHKPKGEIWETPRGGQSVGETCHGHFAYDYDLHYAVAAAAGTTYDRRRRALTRNYDRYGPNSISLSPAIEQTFYNYRDWSEPSIRGPYASSDTSGITLFAQPPQTLRDYRIANSFRFPDDVSSSTGTFKAPADIRLDGGYFERHAAAVYWSGSQSAPYSTPYSTVASSNISFYSGAISYWIKPGFYPETAGKVRSFFSNSRLWTRGSGEWHSKSRAIEFLNPSPFAHFFMPMNDGTENSVITYISGSSESFSNIAQRSFAFGMSYGWQSDVSYYGWYSLLAGGTNTATLNHYGHADNSLERNKFNAHKWVHVSLLWNKTPDEWHWTGSENVPCKKNFQDLAEILVNGQSVNPSWAYYSGSLPHAYMMDPSYTPYWLRDRWYSINPICISDPSVLNNYVTPNYTNRTHNFTADSTIDEFYIWNTRNSAGPIERWRLGRYFRGCLDSGGVRHYGRFTSATIDLSGKGGARVLPPNANVLPTGGETITYPPPASPSPTKARIIGLSWTWYAEDYAFGTQNSPLRHILYDYKPTDLAPFNTPDTLLPSLDFRVTGDGGTTWRSAVNGQMSLDAPAGDLKSISYSVVFNTGSDPLNSILLATPILDDVILYVDPGTPEIVEWLNL